MDDVRRGIEERLIVFLITTIKHYELYGNC